MVDTGVVYGRFQVLHLKHMEYILAAKMRCRKLYIGIVFQDDYRASEEDNLNYRTKKSANPLTYLERYEMIRDALLDFKVPREDFDIVPFPLERPEYLWQYVPKDATYFLSICDEWTEKNQKMFESRGMKTEVLWKRAPEEKGTTGTQIRQRILAAEKWSDLVPKTVYEYVKEHGIDNRIKFTK